MTKEEAISERRHVSLIALPLKASLMTQPDRAVSIPVNSTQPKFVPSTALIFVDRR